MTIKICFLLRLRLHGIDNAPESLPTDILIVGEKENPRNETGKIVTSRKFYRNPLFFLLLLLRDRGRFE
ncbi:hypothetical protein LEP1GSC050_1317 [Leptospira broomii serovar Hurstbridge str. 5399]|uniref:Uncharacterized protein n=1 Tax=Leptospira broomii serovar Hurstbridge str. 5399 TaxID=1049789 RepID=T0F6K7_9LEPT|nr:hypothetical protein LEP1GSC050_1317 [Leptospira broomii serovar Hurstbridge str. 5399]